MNIDVTRGVADWGADVFCEKDGVKYVGQVKMYGTSKTKISRKDVMELYGRDKMPGGMNPRALFSCIAGKEPLRRFLQQKSWE